MAPFMRQDSQDSLVGHEICDLGNISRTPREVDATTRNMVEQPATRFNHDGFFGSPNRPVALSSAVIPGAR